MQTITLDEIENDFKALMHDLTPRYVTQQASGWVWHERLEPPSERTRYFTIRWEPIDTFREGLMGFNAEEVEVEMHILTDYGLVPEQQLKKIMWDDIMQLDDHFQARKSPALSGLLWVEFLDYEEFFYGDGDSAQMDLVFLVRYFKARDT